MHCNKDLDVLVGYSDMEFPITPGALIDGFDETERRRLTPFVSDRCVTLRNVRCPGCFFRGTYHNDMFDRPAPPNIKGIANYVCSLIKCAKGELESNETPGCRK
jgi:hypothetical protein